MFNIDFKIYKNIIEKKVIAEDRMNTNIAADVNFQSCMKYFNPL